MRQVWSGVTTQKSCELMHGCTSGPNGEGRRVRAVQFNGIYSCIRHRGMCLSGHFLLISATRENRAPHMTLWNRHIILVIRYWLGNVFKVQFKQTEKKNITNEGLWICIMFSSRPIRVRMVVEQATFVCYGILCYFTPPILMILISTFHMQFCSDSFSNFDNNYTYLIQYNYTIIIIVQLYNNYITI